VKFISVFGLYAVGYNQNYKLRKYRVKKWREWNMYELTFISHKNDKLHFLSIKQAFLENVQCFSLISLYYIQIYSVMCHKESWRESIRDGITLYTSGTCKIWWVRIYEGCRILQKPVKISVPKRERERGSVCVCVCVRARVVKFVKVLQNQNQQQSHNKNYIIL
jgi:hypothetical protein